MKIKSEIFVLLIILCILFGISAVSASEIQIGDIGGLMIINQALD